MASAATQTKTAIRTRISLQWDKLESFTLTLTSMAFTAFGCTESTIKVSAPRNVPDYQVSRFAVQGGIKNVQPADQRQDGDGDVAESCILLSPSVASNSSGHWVDQGNDD